MIKIVYSLNSWNYNDGKSFSLFSLKSAKPKISRPKFLCTGGGAYSTYMVLDKGYGGGATGGSSRRCAL